MHFINMKNDKLFPLLGLINGKKWWRMKDDKEKKNAFPTLKTKTLLLFLFRIRLVKRRKKKIVVYFHGRCLPPFGSNYSKFFRSTCITNDLLADSVFCMANGKYGIKHTSRSVNEWILENISRLYFGKIFRGIL